MDQGTPALVRTVELEQKLSSDLHDARITRACDYAKQPTLVHTIYDIWVTRVDRAVGVLKLGMVPDVERLKAKLQYLGFTDGRILQQSHVPVVQAGAGKEATVSIAKLPERLRHEIVRIEIRQAASRVFAVRRPSGEQLTRARKLRHIHWGGSYAQE